MNNISISDDDNLIYTWNSKWKKPKPFPKGVGSGVIDCNIKGCTKKAYYFIPIVKDNQSNQTSVCEKHSVYIENPIELKSWKSVDDLNPQFFNQRNKSD